MEKLPIKFVFFPGGVVYRHRGDLLEIALIREILALAFKMLQERA